MKFINSVTFLTGFINIPTWGIIAETIVYDYKYLGCFADSRQRVLNEGYSNMPNMTTKRCLDFCSFSQFTHAGTEAGFECFCGNNDIFTSAEDIYCDRKCVGALDQICGGHWKISIYHITYGSSTANFVPITTQPKADYDYEFSHLRLDRKETNLYKYKLNSATDDRISCRTLGVGGILIIIFPFALFAFFDIMNLKMTRLKKRK